jgi:hypothetical protein
LKPGIDFKQGKRAWSWKKKLKKARNIGRRLLSLSRWWNLFHKEMRSEDYKTLFRIWQFQTLAWKRCRQMHLLAGRFFFFFFA